MLKTLRRNYWLIKEFSHRHHTLIIRTVLSVIALSLVIALFIRYIPAPRPNYRIGLVGKFTPDTLPLEIKELVSLGLVSVDNEGNPQPALAKSWQVENDGKRYSFELDSSYHWHGGSRINPEDLSYNFSNVTMTHNDDQLIFELQDPFAPFFHAVSRPALKDGRLGVGDYTIAKLNVYSGIIQSVVLVSETAKLTYKFYPTENSALTAFKLGELDSLRGLSFVPDELQQDNRILVAPNSDRPKLVVVFFNNNDSALAGKPTKQALAYAIRDKSFGHARATSPIPESSWAYNPLVKTYDYDPDRAKSLLSQDYPQPADFTLELKTMLQYLDEAEIIAEDWRSTLGINVDVKVVTNLTNDYQALLADYTPPEDPDQYTIWHSTQPTNFTHYTNLKVDKLLEDGRRTLDQNLREEIYQDFQRFLLEDSPAIFLFPTSAFDLSRKPLFSK